MTTSSRARASKRNAMQLDNSRGFNSRHPFWKDAIRLRQACESIAMIVDAAYSAGYPLTYNEVATGFSRAPANLDLPSRTALNLRRRYAATIESFSALETMQHMILETVRERTTIEEQLENPGLKAAERKALTDRFDDLSHRAFNWAKDYRQLQITVEGSQISAAAQVASAAAGNPAKQAVIDQITTEIRKQLPAPSSQQELIARYGGDNLKFPDPDYVLGDAADADDDG